MFAEQYTVKEGDTLSKIAQNYGVGVSDISGYRSGDPNKINIGENLSVNKQPLPQVNTIAAENLSAKPYTTPPQTPNTTVFSLTGLVDATRSSIDTYQKEVTAGATNIKDKYDRLGKKETDRTSLYESQGVNTAQKELNEINNTIAAKELAHRRKVEAIMANNPTGQLAQGQRFEIDRADREYASEAADLAIVAQAKLGNFNTLKSIVDTKVDAETADLEKQLESLKFFYKENFDNLSDAKKTKLLQETNVVENDLAQKKELLNQLGELQITAAKAGAPASVITAIGKAGDVSKAITSAGSYLQKAEGSGTSTFTKGQNLKGAANAGVTIDTFDGFDEDTKNFFINGDISGSKKSIDDAFINQGATIDEVIAQIESMGLPPEGEKLLTDYARESAQKNEYTPELQKKDLIRDLTIQKNAKENRATAYDNVKKEWDKDQLMTPEEVALLNEAIDEVYGKRTWLSKILPGGN